MKLAVTKIPIAMFWTGIFHTCVDSLSSFLNSVSFINKILLTFGKPAYFAF